MPKSDDPHFRLRLPAALKASIERAAKDNGRSINAEIVRRLEQSMGLEGSGPTTLLDVAETLDLMSAQIFTLIARDPRLRDLMLQKRAEQPGEMAESEREELSQAIQGDWEDQAVLRNRNSGKNGKLERK